MKHHKDKINDSNYIEELRRHNEDALEFVLRRYGNLLKSEIRCYLQGYQDEQEQCLLDVLMRIWDNIDKFDASMGSFPNWIVALSRYRAIDFLRRNAGVEISSLEELLERGDDVLASLEETASIDISEEIIKAEDFKEKLCDALGSLEPKDRELFIKLFIEEISVEDLSRQTGMSKPIIYNRVSRGRKKIMGRRRKSDEER